MSFFQWDDVAINAGNVEYRTITSVNLTNVTATVEGIDSAIPIHYHCEYLGVNDDGTKLEDEYPDEMDRAGASAFAVGDKARILYRKPNNKSPIIVGFEGEDKSCRPKALLIVAQIATSATHLSDFLCFLWDPVRREIPDYLGIDFPVVVDDARLVELIGFMPEGTRIINSASGERVSEASPITNPSQYTDPTTTLLEFDAQNVPFDPTPLYNVIASPGDAPFPLREIYYDDPLELASNAGGGGGIIGCVQEARDDYNEDGQDYYSDLTLVITDNFEDACLDPDFLVNGGPFGTIWTYMTFDGANALEEYESENFLGDYEYILTYGDMISTSLLIMGPADQEFTTNVPSIEIEDPDDAELPYETFDAWPFRWERLKENGNAVQLINQLWEIRLPFNKPNHDTEQGMFKDRLTPQLRETGYGKSSGFPPQALGGAILEINVGNYEGQKAQIRGSGHHSIYEYTYYIEPSEVEIAEYEEKGQELLEIWKDSAITRHHYKIYLPVNDIVWDIPELVNEATFYTYVTEDIPEEDL